MKYKQEKMELYYAKQLNDSQMKHLTLEEGTVKQYFRSKKMSIEKIKKKSIEPRK